MPVVAIRLIALLSCPASRDRRCTTGTAMICTFPISREFIRSRGSYRDLVFVRVLAWLRNDVKTPRPVAAKRVVALKKYVASGKTFTVLNADRNTLAADGDGSEPLDGSSRLFADMFRPFDLVAAVGDFGPRERLWVACSWRRFWRPCKY
jgi:hypothetical protein